MKPAVMTKSKKGLTGATQVVEREKQNHLNDRQKKPRRSEMSGDFVKIKKKISCPFSSSKDDKSSCNEL